MILEQFCSRFWMISKNRSVRQTSGVKYTCDTQTLHRHGDSKQYAALWSRWSAVQFALERMSCSL